MVQMWHHVELIKIILQVSFESDKNFLERFHCNIARFIGFRFLLGNKSEENLNIYIT